MSGKKQRDAAAEEAVRQEQKNAEDKAEAAAEDKAAASDAKESKDLLGDEDNEDVIF